MRRRAQLLALRPDLEVVPLRGNVPTRLRKLESERLEAVVLACAGLERLGLSDRIGERLAPEVLLPAVCQGTLALETRAGGEVAQAIARLDDERSSRAAQAERSFLARIGGDCNAPVAAFAQWEPGDSMRVRGLVASLDGTRVARAELVDASADAIGLGRKVADAVLADGGGDILATLRAEAAG